MARKRRTGYGGMKDYMELCEESEGFDVNGMGRFLSGGIVECDTSHKTETNKVIMLAKSAVDYYNKENKSDLRYVSLIKYNAHIVGGLMYYITFKARSRTIETISTYQAKVWVQIVGEPIVRICREKPIPDIPVPKGAFLRFMNKLAKIPLLSNWTRRKQIALASKAWKSISTKRKLKYYNKENLVYQECSLVDMSRGPGTEF